MSDVVERRDGKVIIPEEYFEELKEEARLAEEYYRKFGKIVREKGMKEALEGRTDDPDELVEADEIDVDESDVSVEV